MGRGDEARGGGGVDTRWMPGMFGKPSWPGGVGMGDDVVAAAAD